jgi:RND family efflux transporter MFP subunit
MPSRRPPRRNRAPDAHTMATEDPRSLHDTKAPPPPAPRGLRRVGLAAAVAAVFIAVFGILERRGQDAEVSKWTQELAIPTVAVITPHAGASLQRMALPGTVQAWYEAPIYARVNGYVKVWHFDYGAHVKKGDVLAEIETPDLDAQLAAAQAKLNSAKAVVSVREAERQLAQSTYQRWRDSPKGVVSVQEQENKQADYNSAIARLNSASADVDADQGDVDRLQALAGFKNITAPFDGVVTARETDIGALINAGSGTGGGNGPELFRVADIHKMRIYVQVPQQMSAGIRAELTADLRLPQYPDKTFKAAVATTSSAINLNARTLLVELYAENPDGLLQPGAYAQADFEMPSNPNVVRIPTSALVFRERGMEVAIVGPGDRIELKPITIGRNLGTEVEVLTGLTLSERLVNSPPDSLATGDVVRIAAPAPAAAANGERPANAGEEAEAAAPEPKKH